MSLIDIKKEEQKIIKKILNQYIPGIKVYAFGSRVTGKAKPFSDLDLVIYTDKPIDSLIMYYLNDAFSESYLPFKVDILDWASISEEFKKVIQKHWVAFDQ